MTVPWCVLCDGGYGVGPDNGDKAETDHPATELVWVVSNLVLCLCLNVAGACSTAIVLDPHGRDPRGTSRIHWVLCGATSVGLLASTATRSARRAVCGGVSVCTRVVRVVTARVLLHRMAPSTSPGGGAPLSESLFVVPAPRRSYSSLW